MKQLDFSKKTAHGAAQFTLALSAVISKSSQFVTDSRQITSIVTQDLAHLWDAKTLTVGECAWRQWSRDKVQLMIAIHSATESLILLDL